MGITIPIVPPVTLRAKINLPFRQHFGALWVKAFAYKTNPPELLCTNVGVFNVGLPTKAFVLGGGGSCGAQSFCFFLKCFMTVDWWV